MAIAESTNEFNLPRSKEELDNYYKVVELRSTHSQPISQVYNIYSSTGFLENIQIHK